MGSFSYLTGLVQGVVCLLSSAALNSFCNCSAVPKTPSRHVHSTKKTRRYSITLTFSRRHKNQDWFTLGVCLQHAIEFEVQSPRKHEIVASPLTGYTDDMASEFTRSILFPELEREYLDTGRQGGKRAKTSKTLADLLPPLEPIHAAMSWMLGTVAETTTKRTPDPRIFIRETTTSKVLPLDSLRIWTWKN